MKFLDATTFDLSDPQGRRLYELLMEVYDRQDGVDRIVLLAKLVGVPTTNVNLNQALDLALPGILEAAAAVQKLRALVITAADQNAGRRDDFVELLAAGPDSGSASGSGPAGWDEDVDAALAGAGPSRSPVLIALESKDEPLEDSELLKTERHLTVVLTPVQIDEIRRMAVEVAAAVAQGATSSIDAIIDAGSQIWTEFVGAEPRLKGLLEGISKAGLSQPVAWCGRSSLLAELQMAILLAHTGAGGAEGFVSVAAGGHYFMPVNASGERRTMRNRSTATEPSLLEVDLREEQSRELGAVLRDAASTEIVVLVSQAATSATIRTLAAGVRADPLSPTRAVLAFGAALPDVPAVDELLDTLPFVSLAPASIAGPDVLPVLQRALGRYAGSRALACIVAAVRAALVRRSMANDDPLACLDGLSFSTWSWIGLPLFPPGYGEVVPAAYPHLMDLRSVASPGWYFNRRRGIPPAYAADVLAGEVAPDERFHLYLSGAGGTGKSCFLRNVHDQIGFRPTAIAVWYRVDAPSSSWENIEDRLRAETIEAVERRYGSDGLAAMSEIQGKPPLGVFLNLAVARLHALDPAFDEIVMFIDQLERTFESGDEPDPGRLDIISRDLAQLLSTVRVGRGVRVFIASRKQYLPDFLRSSRTAQECGLEFNVLQSIEDPAEQVEFVRRVLDWCHGQHLVSPQLTIQRDAAEELAGSVRGHPLNMMLTLIQLLSARADGDIRATDVTDLRPWEQLFALDLQAAARDDLDWHFLLAMAHARTEIVRFEEIWWRLRMVDPLLTRRVEDLRPEGILERLWLFGYLGRTVHVRPHAGNPARFVEFFHANLRDYLLRDVMARGGSNVDIRKRRTGTPPAWRALDRLSGYARDWKQTQQLLPSDDVRVLMEHREKVIERTASLGEEKPLPFLLLFLRESDEDARETLSDAAMQCFAFSALVHDDLGRQTFTALFPGVDDRVRLCNDWLDRCSADSRPAVLAYLIELESPGAKSLLVRLVLDGHGAATDTIGQEIAAILAEPLYAARYREALVAELLRVALGRTHGDLGRLPLAAIAFAVAACGGERDALSRVLVSCADRLGADADAAMREMAGGLRGADLVDSWLTGAVAHAGYAGVRVMERAALPTESALGLVVGSNVRSVVDDALLATWSQELRERLGVPVPPLRLVGGESEPDEMELRSPRGRMATNLFYPDRVCVQRRHWETFARAARNTGLDSYDVTSDQDVLWLPTDVVARSGYPLAGRSVAEAALDWLEDHCRRSFELILDDDLLTQLLRDVAATPGVATRLSRLDRVQLRQVIIDLVEEGVPIGPPDGPPPGAVIERLAWLVDVQRPEHLTQKLRESLQDEICRRVADDSGQVTTVLLDEQLEEVLVDHVIVQPQRTFLGLKPGEAEELNAAVRRQVERLLSETARPPLVLVTAPTLRYSLARLLRRFDTRQPVLSFTELDLDLIDAVPGGQVSVSGLLKGRA